MEALTKRWGAILVALAVLAFSVLSGGVALAQEGVVIHAAENQKILHEVPRDSAIQATSLQADTALQASNVQRLTYRQDRSALPPLSFDELTFRIRVGDVQNIRATADGRVIPHLLNGTGDVLVTTAATRFEVEVGLAPGQALPSRFGDVTVTELRDDRSWAWSHGFDDNIGIRPGIQLFEQRGWAGSLYLIGSLIDRNRDEPWIVDEPAARQLLEGGWSLGGHGWTNGCDDADRASVEQSRDRLTEIVDRSSRRDYEVTAFAAPCFLPEYHPVVLDLRGEAARNNNSSAFQFNESGNDFVVALGENERVDGFGNLSIQTPSGVIVAGFDPNRRIGRDTRLEVNDFNGVRTDIDWIARQAANGRPLWYNSLLHGFKEDNLAPVINYIHDTYGPGGTNEVWVAPADEVFSYVMVRNATNVTLESRTSGPSLVGNGLLGRSVAEGLPSSGDCPVTSRRWNGRTLEFECG